MMKIGLYWIHYLYWVALIPLYIVLAPLCMISSELFDWVISWVTEDQTFTLMGILLGEWVLSGILIF
jgi:uncharacterized membrane protein